MRILHVASGKYSEALVSLLQREELTDEIKTGFDFDWEKEEGDAIYKIAMINDAGIMGLMSVQVIPGEYRVEIKLLESARENTGKDKIYDRIAGCLIATACQLSFERGFDGFVSLIPKSKLIPHYIEKYFFLQLAGTSQ